MTETKKAATAKASSKQKAVNDVAHPGTTAPSDTSKPIINQRPMIKDPMVVEDDAKPEEPAVKLPAKQTARPNIKPPEPDEPEPKITEATDKTDKKDEVPEGEPEGESVGKPEDDPAETPVGTPDEKSGDDKPANDSKDKKTKQPDADDQAAAARDAKLQHLIESKKYELPINAVEHRKSEQFVAIGFLLALILAAAWVNIALDAGLIHLGGLKAVTHFFSN
jgi:hypothetical protein